MDLLQPLMAALAPLTLFYIILGVVLGIVVGSIPGLTGSMLIALSLPFTFTMEAVNAISMLVAMYVGGVLRVADHRGADAGCPAPRRR